MSVDFPLEEGHKQQVQSFLRFTNVKRDQHLREVEITLDDFKDLKVPDGVSTRRAWGLSNNASLSHIDQTFSAT